MGQKVAYLFLLLIEVVNDHTNEEIEGEEGAKDDEDDKVDVHVDVVFIDGLAFHLKENPSAVMDTVLNLDRITSNIINQSGFMTQ